MRLLWSAVERRVTGAVGGSSSVAIVATRARLEQPGRHLQRSPPNLFDEPHGAAFLSSYNIYHAISMPPNMARHNDDMAGSHIVLPNDMAPARLPCLKRHIGGMLTGRQILYPVDLKENAIIF